MKKLVMLIVVLSLFIVQGYAQKRTLENVDWNKVSEEISNCVTQSLEDLDVDLPDLSIELQELPELSFDSNVLKDLEATKLYAYNLNEQHAKVDQVVQRETERAKREAQHAKRELQAKKLQVYSSSYSGNTSQHSNDNADVFENISNIKGVEVVYISKALLGMMPSMDMPGVNIGKVAGKLESLQVYSAEDRNPATILKQMVNRLVRSDTYETLMLVKDSDSKTAFYLKNAGKDKKSELLMVTEDGDEVSVIRMLGYFTLQDIQNLTKGQTIKK